jgi:type IV fimbrial biogenesis protein FimT
MLESMMTARRAKRPMRGFTIIELMTVVLVAGVLLALAVPSMREFAARQRVKAVNAELVTDLQYARSESITRGVDVGVEFRTGDTTMTCYTIRTSAVTVGRCDCRRPPGTACPNLPELVELKTVQVPRSTSITLQPPALPDNYIEFHERQGGSNRDDFRVTVASSISGQLRTSSNKLGRLQVCSPDGSIGGVPACAD